jgi:hypothetical protein
MVHARITRDRNCPTGNADTDGDVERLASPVMAMWKLDDHRASLDVRKRNSESIRPGFDRLLGRRTDIHPSKRDLDRYCHE